MANLLFTMDINIDTDIIRERSTLLSKNNSKKLLTFSIAYYERIEVLNLILTDKVQDPTDNSQLSYVLNKKEDNKDK